MHARGGPTTVIADGNLYVVVRSAQRRYLFGASDRPVLSVREALRLVRALGFTGTDAQLIHRLGGNGIPGATYTDAGSISDFTLGCQGTYTATAVVRSDAARHPGVLHARAVGAGRCAHLSDIPCPTRGSSPRVRDRLGRQREGRQHRAVPSRWHAVPY